MILELSHKGQAKTPTQSIVAELAECYYSRRGMRFVQLAHRRLSAQPQAGGVDLLLRYLSAVPTVAELLRVQDVLASGPARISSVEFASEVRRERLIAMARRGELQLVGPPPYGLETLVALPTTRGAL